MSASQISLVAPCAALLGGYAAALRAGWSPNTMRDVSAEELEAVEADPEGFLRDLTDEKGMVTLADGSHVPRLPFRIFWIDDGEFCGAIGLRFQRSTEDLPPHVPGHIGYSIVPWKRRRSYATRALRLILPVARAEGLRRVLVTCDADNEASRKVIAANGGVLDGFTPHDPETGRPKLSYWIRT